MAKRTLEQSTVPENATENMRPSMSEQEKIALLAYSYWQARGCPEGSSEEDWFRAEEELRSTKTSFAASA